MRFFVIFITLLTLNWAGSTEVYAAKPSAKSQKNCATQLTSDLFVDLFQSPEVLPLPVDMIEQIKKSPRTKKLRAKFNHIKTISVLSSVSGIVRRNRPQTGFQPQPLRSNVKGEGLQAQFLRKLLAVILPDVEFSGSDKPDMRMQIVDLSEDDRPFPMVASGAIDINRLKPLNPIHIETTKAKLKAFLGLKPADTVVSLYFDFAKQRKNKGQRSSPEVYPYIEEICDYIRENIGPKVIIVSVGDHNMTKPRWAQKQISKLKKNELARSPVDTTVIYNDTMGYMPYLIAASDIHIVRGPINIFEGLNVGTPTLVFNNHETLGGYNRETYETNLRIAKRSSGFRTISHMDSFDEAFTALLSARNIQPPYRQNNYHLVKTFLQYLIEEFE